MPAFSMRWAIFSAAIFLASQLTLGFWLADLVQGTRLSLHTRFLTEAVFNLASYFVGGVIVGLISPGVRIREPAFGAFLCVAAMFVVSAFTPLSFIRFSMVKLLVGGAIAFGLALTGAKLGEKLAGNHLPP